MNRAQRRKDAGVNKTGLHRKDRSLLLIFGREMWRQHTQFIFTKSGKIKTITHTQFVR